MAGILNTVYFASILATCTVHGEITKQCQPHWGSSGNLPKLPEAFTAIIEANIINKNYSSLLTEYYDDAGNRGAVTIRSGKGDGRWRHHIYSYDTDEVISIDKKSGTCDVYPLEEKPIRLFGVRLLNGKPHIRGVTRVLHFGSEFNQTYMGTTYVRGIRCDHWQACINTNHSSYTLDYFFSAPGWNSSYQISVVPVRAVINGSMISTHHGGANKTIKFHNVYEFFSFKPGSPDEDVYEIPRGTFCPRKKNTNNATLPDLKWFSFGGEWIVSRNKSMYHFREFYNYEMKLLRVDHRNYSKKASERTHISEIHDFNTGIMYTIYNTTGVSTCEMSTLNSRRAWDAKEDDTHNIKLKTSRELLLLTNFSHFGYEGVANVRGFEADVWSQSRRFRGKNSTFVELYYLRPEWKFTADAGGVERRIPVQMTFKAHWGKIILNIYNFDESPQDLVLYDISACFPRDTKHKIEIRFAGVSENIAISDHRLVNALRRTIFQKATVAPIRVADIKIQRLPPKYNSMSVTFVLLDRPDPNLEGISVNVTHEDAPLKLALRYLKESVTQGNFHFYVKMADGTSTRLTADREVFFVDGQPNGTSTPPPVMPLSCAPSHKGLTKSEAVGLAFGMIILGIIIGVLIGIIVMKRYGEQIAQFSFKPQVNESTNKEQST